MDRLGVWGLKYRVYRVEGFGLRVVRLKGLRFPLWRPLYRIAVGAAMSLVSEGRRSAHWNSRVRLVLKLSVQGSGFRVRAVSV